MMFPRNRYLEALKESPNVVGMATALALSAALLNPLPLLVGLVAEAAYLAFVPDSKWYESRLSTRYDQEVERRRNEIKNKVMPTLRPGMQARYMRLEEMRAGMGAQVVKEEKWFREVLRKLDFLLEKFLQFAAKEAQFRVYLAEARDEVRAQNRYGHQPPPRPNLRAVDDAPRRIARPDQNPAAAPVRDASDSWVHQVIDEVRAHYEQDLGSLRTLMENQPDDDTRAVLSKRLDVLTRRSEFIEKMGRILINLNHQLSLVEDTFGLISDELLARPPEQVLADIEDVVSQTNTMTQVLEEVASFDHLLARLKG